MARIPILNRENNMPLFILTSFFLLSNFYVHADVKYSTPLQGKEFQMGNRLEWKTAYELDTKFFIIEKSNDGVNFYREREIKAAGNSDIEKGYRFLDIGNNDEITYYRLKLIDLDETESYSTIAIVKKTMANNFQIVRMSETSVFKNFEVTIDALAEKQLSYSLENYKGEKIFSTKMPLVNGLNEIEINMKDEPVGRYKLLFTVEDETEIITIRKTEKERADRVKENVASAKKKTIKKG